MPLPQPRALDRSGCGTSRPRSKACAGSCSPAASPTVTTCAPAPSPASARSWSTWSGSRNPAGRSSESARLSKPHEAGLLPERDAQCPPGVRLCGSVAPFDSVRLLHQPFPSRGLAAGPVLVRRQLISGCWKRGPLETKIAASFSSTWQERRNHFRPPTRTAPPHHEGIRQRAPNVLAACRIPTGDDLLLGRRRPRSLSWIV